MDLRNDYDETATVKDGVLYRKGSIVQVWWIESGKETWDLPNTVWGIEEAKRNFNEMKERFNE